MTAGRPATSAAPPARGRGSLPVPSELLVLALVAVAVLIAAAVDDGLDAGLAWSLVTVLSAAFILSRGLVKRGTGGDGL